MLYGVLIFIILISISKSVLHFLYWQQAGGDVEELLIILDINDRRDILEITEIRGANYVLYIENK